MCICSVFLLGLKGVYAYEFPNSSYYIEFLDSNLGSVKLYFPYVSAQTLTLDEDNQIVNISSSSVTAYFTYNNVDYTATFSVFQYGRYRLTNTGNYLYFDIKEILDTNISFLDEQSLFIHINSDFINTCAFLIGGGLLLLILLKR